MQLAVLFTVGFCGSFNLFATVRAWQRALVAREAVICAVRRRQSAWRDSCLGRKAIAAGVEFLVERFIRFSIFCVQQTWVSGSFFQEPFVSGGFVTFISHARLGLTGTDRVHEWFVFFEKWLLTTGKSEHTQQCSYFDVMANHNKRTSSMSPR
jgi:hypothetical protein